VKFVAVTFSPGEEATGAGGLTYSVYRDTCDGKGRAGDAEAETLYYRTCDSLLAFGLNI
jgi:hypothetical protein